MTRLLNSETKATLMAMFREWLHFSVKPKFCFYHSGMDDDQLLKLFIAKTRIEMTKSNLAHHRKDNFGRLLPQAEQEPWLASRAQASIPVAQVTAPTPVPTPVPAKREYLVDNMNAFREWVEKFRTRDDLVDIVAWLDAYGRRELGDDTKRYLVQAFFTVHDDYYEPWMPKHWRDRKSFQSKTRRRMRDLELALRAYLDVILATDG